jgi:hypothetical protein
LSERRLRKAYLVIKASAPSFDLLIISDFSCYGGEFPVWLHKPCQRAQARYSFKICAMGWPSPPVVTRQAENISARKGCGNRFPSYCFSDGAGAFTFGEILRAPRLGDSLTGLAALLENQVQ